MCSDEERAVCETARSDFSQSCCDGHRSHGLPPSSDHLRLFGDDGSERPAGGLQ
jgi:hypothetical protein